MSKQSTKSVKIQIRLDERQKNKAQIRANLYFKGNLSKWIKYCLENCNTRKIKREEL